MTLAADASLRSADDRHLLPAPADASPVAAFDYAAPGVADLRPAPTRRLRLPGPHEARGTRAAWIVVALVVSALYFTLLMCYWAPAHPGVDQNGYLVGGRQFSHTMSSGMKPESDFGFVGRMWIRTTDDATGVYYPKYPLGLPIYYAANLWLGEHLGFDGHETAQLLSPIGATLAVFGTFLIVRRLSGGFVGVIAMLLVGLGQVMLTLSVNPNSHASGTGAVVLGFAFLIGWLETGALWRGILAGLFFGIAYTIRYTEGLLLLPLGVAMLYAARWAAPSWRRVAITAGATVAFVLVAFIVARFFGDKLVAQMEWLSPLAADGGKPFKALVGALALASVVWLFMPWRTLWRLLAVGGAWLAPVLYLTLFNMVAMRSFTSYAGTNESTGFAWDYFLGNWEKMVRVIADQGLFFIAPLGLLGLLLMFRRLPLVATLLALWFFPSVLLYTAYYWAPDNFGVSYSRFVLTQLPALVVSAAWLIGEAAGLRRTAGRTGWIRPSIPAGLIAAGVALACLGLAGWAGMTYDPRRERFFWLLAVPSAIVGVVAIGRVLANVEMAAHFRRRFEQQVGGALPRVAVGAVAFVACALGSFRASEGIEWGQRANARASLEVQSRENNNLAELGRQLRDAVARDAEGKRPATPPVPDEKVILFADGERLHHLQWVGNWATFDANAFTPEAGRKFGAKPAFDANDPDPIDPNTCTFMRGVYANKDEKTLVAMQNQLMSEALASGKRIFYVLSKPAANLFERRYVNGRPFEARVVGTFCEMPSPREPDDFLPPDEQRKQPVGRNFMRRNVPSRFTTPDRQTFRIVEIVEKGAVPPAPVRNSIEDKMAERRAEAAAAAAAAAKPAAAKPPAPTVVDRMATRRAERDATTKPALAPSATEQRIVERRAERAATTAPSTVEQRIVERRVERAATTAPSTVEQRIVERRVERAATTAPSTVEQRIVERRAERAASTAPAVVTTRPTRPAAPPTTSPATRPAAAGPTTRP